MSFDSGALINIGAVAGGERYGSFNMILSATTFEDGLKVGRFAKLDTASIDNFDSSATPVPAGVVLRSASNPVENDGTYDADNVNIVEYIREGMTTVDVKVGETPSMFDRVYISNDGDASDGLATATNTDVAVNGEFIIEVATNVWLINLAAPAGDVATHVADALGAHAASAVSVLDAGTVFTGINVETVTKELYDKIQDHEDDTAAAHAASAISLLDAGGFTSVETIELALAELYPKVTAVVADPGDGGAIPVTRSATVAITTTGVDDTRTLAIPTFAGQVLDISLDVDAGDVVITVAAAVNQAGNTILTGADAGDHIQLTGVTVAGALVWRVAANDGWALS